MHQKILILLLAVAITGCSFVSSRKANQALDYIEILGSGKFESHQDFARYVGQTQSIRKYIDDKHRANSGCSIFSSICIEEIVVTGSMVTNPEITNNQESGVDEGDIVKVIGDYLVILRQGKLFSVRYGGDKLEPANSASVIKQGWEHEAWIDELLVYNRTIVVIGYAYDGVIEEGTVELNILSLDEDGAFTHDNTFIIQAGDYFSSQNYASRVVDGQLIFNFPIPFDEIEFDNLDATGALQFARIGQLPENPQQPITWRSLLDSGDIYKPSEVVIYPTLHVYVKCNLESMLNQCVSTGVIASQYSIPSYVSARSIYFTTSSLKKPYIIEAEFDWSLRDDPDNFQHNLHKVNLETMNQSVVPINGEPFNQFSFYEKDETLYLVTSKLYFDNQKLDIFLDTIGEDDFQTPGYLPNPQLVGIYNDENWPTTRFVDDWLTVSLSDFFWESEDSSAPFLKLHHINSHQSFEIGLEHSAQRVEPLNEKLLVMGYSGETQFHGSVVGLENSPQLLATHHFEDIVESEYRSHAFNALSLPDGSDLFGFTTLGMEPQSHSNYYDDDQASDILFVEVHNNDTMQPAGIFKSKQKSEEVDDDCTISCVDWYGNTRPFFLEGKIYGLAGYELIKGEYFQGEIRETSRVDYRLTR